MFSFLKHDAERLCELCSNGPVEDCDPDTKAINATMAMSKPFLPVSYIYIYVYIYITGWFFGTLGADISLRPLLFFPFLGRWKFTPPALECCWFNPNSSLQTMGIRYHGL